MNDQSVVNDFMSETFGATEKEKKDSLRYLTLENASAVLGHAVTLIGSKYTSYNKTGMEVLKNVFNAFSEQIHAIKKTAVSDKVDLAREDRIQKCDNLVSQLESVLSKPGFENAMKSPDIELQHLTGQLDNDIDFFISNLKKS